MEKFLHVLVVEDNPEVRELMCCILIELGYRASVAENGAAARPLLESQGVDLLVTDEVMSGERGHELADYARSLGIPTLLMSADNSIKQELEGGIHGFIGKPFRLEELRKEIEKALAKPSQGGARA